VREVDSTHQQIVLLRLQVLTHHSVHNSCFIGHISSAICPSFCLSFMLATCRKARSRNRVSFVLATRSISNKVFGAVAGIRPVLVAFLLSYHTGTLAEPPTGRIRYSHYCWLGRARQTATQHGAAWLWFY
jgi:hypothetical protein